MLDLSYYVGDRFVFYDSNLGLYFTLDNGDGDEDIGWINHRNNSCHFATGYLVVTELLKLLNDNRSLSGIGEYVIGVANDFKSVGLDNIWVVPVDFIDGGGGDVIDLSDVIDFIDVIDFSGGIRLEDILSNARS